MCKRCLMFKCSELVYTRRLVTAIALGLWFCGCASELKPSATSHGSASSTKIEIRNNAVSLLYDLLGDEKDVSKILLIKRNSEELGRLIKLISKTSADAEKELADMARAHPDLPLHALELPPGEKATRNAIAKTKERELLFTSGADFEFNLLLTQADALSYGWHLARIAAENTPRPDEMDKFNRLSQKLKDLDDQVRNRMHQK